MSTKIPVIYSSKHLAHYPKLMFFGGMLEDYPETPDRIETIKNHLENAAFVQMMEPGEPISEAKIAETHEPGYVRYFRELSSEADAWMEREFARFGKAHLLPAERYIYPDLFPIRRSMSRVIDSPSAQLGYYSFDNTAPIGQGTWQAALDAATAAVQGADLVLEGKSRIAYALCRPPGHHAGYDFMGGYCYLNNAAIAANHLKKMGNLAVLDIDYHHGNGTQNIFWDDTQVFFASIHAHPAHEYPFYAGYEDEIGGEKARHTTANVPLPHGTASAEFMAGLEKLLNQIVDFKPECIVVSLGFDTFRDDAHGLFKLVHEDYREIGKKLAALNMPLLYIQEGGYKVEALGELAEEILKGTLNL